MERIISVSMQLPGLFFIEHWYHYRYKSFPNSFKPEDIIICIETCSVLLLGFLLLLLPLQYVKVLYTHFLSGFIILICHELSKLYINFEIEFQENKWKNSYISECRVLMLVLYGCFGSLVNYLLKGPWMTSIPLTSIYAIPVIAQLAKLPVSTLPTVQCICNGIIICCVFLYCTYQIPKVIECAKLAYADAVVLTEMHGLIRLLIILWDKLFVPSHFALFWLIEFIFNFATVMYDKNQFPWGSEWYITLLTVISSICVSPIMLLATAVSVSYLSYFIMCSTKAYLLWAPAVYENVANNGLTEGFIIMYLALQTGFLEMKIPFKLAVMTIILFIVSSSLMSSMLEITEPVLLGLSASRSWNKWRHFRALSMCIALFVFPLYLSKSICSIFPLDIWLVVVLSNCLITSVAVVDLLIVYSLFLYDSLRTETWENLDDIVYYTRAITKVLEFLTGIIVVMQGLWEWMSTSEKWNWINGSILIFHFYVNVVLRLQTGWKSFLLRRKAFEKAKCLPAATSEQMDQYNDVCSICFGSMTAACITPCQHFFHRTCLRKWLYIQDRCPLCHNVVTVPSSSETQVTRQLNS